jgi:anti-sigma regulatory factor (Ser/Thr protein kinase)
VLIGPARDDIAILTISLLRQSLHTETQPAAHKSSHWNFEAANGVAAQCARTEFAAILRGSLNAREDDIFGAELVFGELVGNVLRHAHGMTDVFVDWSGPAPILHVRDQGLGCMHSPRLPHDLFSESGRGLYIIAAMTEEFNITRMAGGGSHARAVISINPNRLFRTACG